MSAPDRDTVRAAREDYPNAYRIAYSDEEHCSRGLPRHDAAVETIQMFLELDRLRALSGDSTPTEPCSFRWPDEDNIDEWHECTRSGGHSIHVCDCEARTQRALTLTSERPLSASHPLTMIPDAAALSGDTEPPK